MRSFSAALIAVALTAGHIAGCGGGDDSLGFNTPPPVDPPVEESIVPAAGGLRRLRAAQYVNSVRLILGDIAAAAAAPPDDAGLHGFDSIGAAELSLPETAVEQYEKSARDVAFAAVDDIATLDTLLPCTPTGEADAACFQAFVTSVGRLAWRRPLSADEVTPLVNVAVAAGTSEGGSFELGLAYALSGILQSPYFLYIVEVGETDTQNATRRRLTGPELASRMSFFLLDTTPDEALLDKAESGGLATLEDIRAVARLMLSRPAARDALATFYSELFHLRDLDTITKNAELFPLFSPSLAQSMKEETLRLISDVVWTRNTDAREIYVADYAFINGDLAALYGVQSPGAGFQKVTLPAEQKRAGLLGSASFLARFAHPAKTSPTKRGLFVQAALLCQEIPVAPPGVDTTLPPDDPDNPQTLRAKLQKHLTEDTCRSCHQSMDPIGFALENYDGIGSFRTKDVGLPIDSTADIEGLGSFASARELGAILRDDPRGAACMITNLYRNSMGHLETKGELPALRSLEEVFAASGYSMQDLLVEIVGSPAFQLVSDPK